MKPHAFVVMPFGSKPDTSGRMIDFNRVYAEYIKPALEDAGLAVFRADEELRAGDIKSDMFQALLIADLVVADLSVDNPNVWYELGVRHALRSRGVVLVNGGHSPKAFDVYTDRKLRYTPLEDQPDDTTRRQERAELTAMVRASMQSWQGRKISPVYQLMPNLQEPDWKSLRTGDMMEFWALHDAWEDRITLAQRESRIGDLLVLADEAPVAAFRAEAWIKAGATLRRAEQFRFALEPLRRGLEIEPANLCGLMETGMCLQRLALRGEAGFSIVGARQHYLDALTLYPGASELWALLGRLDKDAWCLAWRRMGLSHEGMREEAADEEAMLRVAIESYGEGYRINPAHYYSGINALTLMHVHRDITGESRYEDAIRLTTGAVRFAATVETQPEALFYAKATLGDLAVLEGSPASVKRAYKEAIVHSANDWFALHSCRAQLLMLADLGMFPDRVAAGIAVFNKALDKIRRPQNGWTPRRVFLFSGHMVDAAERQTPRFPQDKVAAAAANIADTLQQFEAGADDLALTQGACGGDLLFTKACQARGVQVQWLQPFDEPAFIERSVAVRGPDWRERYLQARASLILPILSAPQRLGPAPPQSEPGYAFERCNLWLLHTALAYGPDKVHFICLWDGEGADRPGGTAHMCGEVRRRTGQVTQIDTREL